MYIAHIKNPGPLETENSRSIRILPRQNFKIRKATNKKNNFYSMCNYDIHTLGSLLLLHSLCAVLRFPMCELWEHTEISLSNESDGLKYQTILLFLSFSIG